MKWLLILVFAAFVAIGSGCEKKRTPERHLIPSNYEGVVITVYEQAGFPALPVENGFRLHRYPADGILITSSIQEFGWASDEKWDVLSDGSYRPLGSPQSPQRAERYSATGGVSVGKNEINYLFRVIGTKAYWDRIDATEYDRKVEAARGKIRAARTLPK